MEIKEFATKIAELHYPNKPNAIIDEPYRKVRMNTLIQQIESEFKILNLSFVSVSVCKLGAFKDGYCENYRCAADCDGCDFKQTER
jgi:hypothetical protein